MLNGVRSRWMQLNKITNVEVRIVSHALALELKA